MTLWPRRVLLALSVLAALLLPARSAFAFTDVSSKYWDFAAIKYVATTNAWMRDFGTSSFKPKALETRKLVASALVKAFASGEAIDSSITFPDLPTSDPYYPYANVAVKLGWISRLAGGNFGPSISMRTEVFDRAVVLAMGLSGPADGLRHITDEKGYTYPVPPFYPYLQIARTLQLHYNHATESSDLEPTTGIPRDEAAYSLWKAKTDPSWLVSETSRFTSVVLPGLNASDSIQAAKRQLTTFALRYVGYPYIWAGEWYRASPAGYCCGAQPKGGFDCSGFAWWLLKRYEAGYNAAQVRGYGGWPLAQRTSYDMARATPTRITFGKLRIGDIMMIADGGGHTWSDVDHVGVYLGNGWMIHSTGSRDGPALEWGGDGWYHDHFVWGRRVIG